MTLDADEQLLMDYRALRQEAWALVRDDVAALREDLEQRGLGGRLADRVGDEARDVWEQTLDVASAHRGIVATTVVALIAWLLRRPIGHGVAAMFGGDHHDEPPPARTGPADDAGKPEVAEDTGGETT